VVRHLSLMARDSLAQIKVIHADQSAFTFMVEKIEIKPRNYPAKFFIISFATVI
jgi:hypothetical protein